MRISPRAAIQIRKAGEWWLAHREKAPDAFVDDLQRGMELIASLVAVGEPVPHPHLTGVRRLVNLALAARSLAWAGYYDEALLLIRSGAEVTNLLQLFSIQPDRELAWGAAPESSEFTPVKVRLAIEGEGASPFVHHDRYKALCRIAAHATQDFALTSHEPTDKPITPLVRGLLLRACFLSLARSWPLSSRALSRREASRSSRRSGRSGYGVWRRT